MVFAEIIIFFIAIAVALLLFKMFASILHLLVHAVIGLLILYIARALGLKVSISLLTVLICVFGGALGAIIVIILSYLKIAFVEE